MECFKVTVIGEHHMTLERSLEESQADGLG